MQAIARHRAAIRRHELSRPVRMAINDGVLGAGFTVFDYGCGHGDDVRALQQRGFEAHGWDPVLRAGAACVPSDLVNLGYVLNVIEDAAERADALRAAWALTGRVLVVAVRTKLDEPLAPGHPFADGYCTRLGTFQKFFEQEEARALIDGVLGARCLAAAPGVFYLFRDEEQREALAARRFRRQGPSLRLSPDDVFRAHEAMLRPIADFVNAHGRLPDHSEVNGAGEVTAALGSFRRACSIVRRVLGEEALTAIEMLRSEDLLVYLALSRFDGRPALSRLPRDLQLDVRALFRSYARACALADEVLLAAGDMQLIVRACRSSAVGKKTPSALYLHISALDAAPPLLRVYEGCARSLVGVVGNANVVKLHLDGPAVSYLSYPDFERLAHPALARAVVVHLRGRRVDVRHYDDTRNPPILHRKEAFVHRDHPMRERFSRLTAQEEKAGLFERPDHIGTRYGWNAELARRGVRVSGHRLVRA